MLILQINFILLIPKCQEQGKVTEDTKLAQI